MTGPVFRGPPASALLARELDVLTAVYHRPSGTTHLLASPAPEILALLAEPMTLDAMLDRLLADFALVDADQDALAARVEELVAAGLVAAA